MNFSATLPSRLRNRGLSMGLLLVALMMGSTTAAAQGYDLIDPPQNTSTPDKVEVIEFFWLGCPHCYAFEPTILKWEKDKPDYVSFSREAPPLNPSWETHSRSFYAAQLLGKEHEFVDAMFDAIHEQRKNMRKPKDIAKLAETLGMDPDKFLKTMKSFAVETKMRRAIQLAKGAGLTGVPAVMINGKYRTSASKAGGYPAVIDVINERSEFEKEEMGLAN
ncbi:MAG: thiol:disulfide interchange protein DsbA/DsbL [Gammaproteobacteria bacterium]|nr:thiol:disulfide interchange protein DsbA/DsbL [Gammaproteobacteria bacterium]